MIKKTLIPIITILILGSCSNKMSLVKRKYNKGYYVSTSKKNDNDPVAKDVKKPVAVPKKKEIQEEIVTAKTLDNFKVLYSSVISATQEIKHEKNHNETASLFSKKPVNSVQKRVKVFTAENLINITQPKKGASDDKIIQIILALFPVLCLIAVFLHDGKAITLNFWVTLLLHLTLIGEIIFALLVVLDIVNLA
jgi:DNA-binding cell septation regulator SpoVG